VAANASYILDTENNVKLNGVDFVLILLELQVLSHLEFHPFLNHLRQSQDIAYRRKHNWQDKTDRGNPKVDINKRRCDRDEDEDKGNQPIEDAVVEALFNVQCLEVDVCGGGGGCQSWVEADKGADLVYKGGWVVSAEGAVDGCGWSLLLVTDCAALGEASSLMGL
jgi:hypothetical protein